MSVHKVRSWILTTRGFKVLSLFVCRYVLLKERNMLLTLEHEANKFRYVMPAPDRMRKVSEDVIPYLFLKDCVVETCAYNLNN